MIINIEEKFVQVRGGELYVRLWQTNGAKGLPIVLLHDSLGCVALWRDFPEMLALILNRPVIAYDRLGFGRSSQRLDEPSWTFIADEASDFLPEVMKDFGFEKYVLFGHSVGGGMSLTAAAESNPAVAAVIAESSQAFVEERTRDGIRAAKANFADPAQLARLEKWHGPRAKWVLDAWTEVWLHDNYTDWSIDSWSSTVTCPVLVIHGELDEFGSYAFPERIAQTVKGPIQLELMAQCGHVPHREKQAEVLGLVERFLSKHNIP